MAPRRDTAGRSPGATYEDRVELPLGRRDIQSAYAWPEGNSMPASCAIDRGEHRRIGGLPVGLGRITVLRVANTSSPSPYGFGMGGAFTLTK